MFHRKIGTIINFKKIFSQERVMRTGDNAQFYRENRKWLLKMLDWMIKRVNHVLAEKFDPDKVHEISNDIRKEFEKLLDELPYIGGFKNDHTWYLIGATICLSIHKALKKQDCGIQASGRIIHEMVAGLIDSFPRLIVRFWGRIFFSIYYKRLSKQSADTLNEEYPYNWIFYVINGNGKDYDFGVDYHKCFIHRFFTERNHEELIPYMCALDYVISEAFGWGLVRTQTIQRGDGVCNFRYKRGRDTKPVLPEGLLIK